MKIKIQKVNSDRPDKYGLREMEVEETRAVEIKNMAGVELKKALKVLQLRIGNSIINIQKRTGRKFSTATEKNKILYTRNQ